MSFKGDVLGYWGRNLIEDHHDRLLKKLPPPDRQFRTLHLPQLSDEGHDRTLTPRTVGILGAGVGGLYTALMLDSLDINYEILEASDHPGGRLFTHKFPGGNKYDYYVCCSFRVGTLGSHVAFLLSRLTRMWVP